MRIKTGVISLLALLVLLAGGFVVAYKTHALFTLPPTGKPATPTDKANGILEQVQATLMPSHVELPIPVPRQSGPSAPQEETVVERTVESSASTGNQHAEGNQVSVETGNARAEASVTQQHGQEPEATTVVEGEDTNVEVRIVQVQRTSPVSPRRTLLFELPILPFLNR